MIDWLNNNYFLVSNILIIIGMIHQEYRFRRDYRLLERRYLDHVDEIMRRK